MSKMGWIRVSSIRSREVSSREEGETTCLVMIFGMWCVEYATEDEDVLV